MLRKLKKYFKLRWLGFWLEYHKELARAVKGPKWEYHFDRVGEIEKELELVIQEG